MLQNQTQKYIIFENLSLGAVFGDSDRNFWEKIPYQVKKFHFSTFSKKVQNKNIKVVPKYGPQIKALMLYHPKCPELSLDEKIMSIGCLEPCIASWKASSGWLHRFYAKSMQPTYFFYSNRLRNLLFFTLVMSKFLKFD